MCKSMASIICKTYSERDTLRVGKLLGKGLRPGDIVLLCGNLGSGKTIFTKGIARGMGYKDYIKVKSPTFAIVHKIDTRVPLYHFDLYRLEDEAELYEIGFDEYCDENNIVVIEWGDKFDNYVPRDHICVNFSTQSPEQRTLNIKASNKHSLRYIEKEEF